MRKETLIVYTFAFVLFGCGDEVTKVYNTYPDTSVSILESEKKLSKQDCDSLNIGDIVFIKDSASVYTCNGKEWISLRGANGRDGQNGTDGHDGQNGENGSDGKNGQEGLGCSIVSKDIDSLKISCGKDTASLFIGINDEISGEKPNILVDERDGKQYRIATIGRQTWMAENLNYEYNEGSAQSVCSTEENGVCLQYGRYYTWAAAVDSAAIFSKSGATCGYDFKCGLDGTTVVRGVCPNGWHLPSSKEWLTLRSIMGTPDMWWSDTKYGANYDSYGLSVLVSGRCTRNGSLQNDFSCNPTLKTTSGTLVEEAYFWSSDEYDYTNAYYWSLNRNSFMWDASGTNTMYNNKSQAYSVRCVKDY